MPNGTTLTTPSTIPLTLTPDSEKIHAYGYDADRKRLAVQFKSFSEGLETPRPPAWTYEYLNVEPDKLAGLEAAESKGKFVNDTFVKTQWPFEKLPTTA
jgi:hypothetical protein